ncbi:hypothetical protein [Leucothrix arctica]|uniref:Cellulose-binding protein n=1 Tax=Leucothrix arctica TaxID=1481894 RepID=A0A317CT37_9GAMM|nr:hypothetical protein [Leucothrix arctica]PWQ99600.1 hypothetical protein DKT75_00585 [Leucothrix arctica]
MANYRKLLTLIVGSALLALSSVQAHAKMPLGINTNEVTEQDASAPFVDLMKMSKPFDESNRLTKGYIEYDKNGWPSNLKGGVAGSNVIHWVPAGTLPDGNYTVLYDGEGQLTYGADARVVHSAPGKDIVQVRAGKDQWLQVTMLIKRSNPKNYVRNIRFLLPGGICANNPFKRVNSAKQCSGNFQSFEKYHKHILFNPDYLNFMRSFKVIRMMNISGITRNHVSDWNALPTMEQATWAGSEGRRGVPLEVMVKLANKLNATPWFNIPQEADNNLIRNYALYVKKHLRPHLKPYLEYTNEAWNSAFSSASYTKAMGLKQKLDVDRAQAGHKFYVKRSLEIFNIWTQVYGSSRPFTRVLGGWSANPRLTPILLNYMSAYKSVDAFAIAPYFFVHQRNLHEVHTVPDVFRLLKDPKNPYSMDNVYKMLERQKVQADKFKVKLIAYEGGQHLVAQGTRSTKDKPNPQLIGANRANPMEGLYVEFLNNWKRITGDQLFVVFSAPRPPQFFGSWGIKEYLNQPDSKAPKYRGIKRFF